MGTKRRRTSGRSRKPAARHECGKLVQNPREIIPTEAIIRRAELVGMKNVRHHDASTPLGQLKLRTWITERQFQAGIRFEDAHRRWAMLADCKPHTAQVGEREGGTRPDPTMEEWLKAKQRYLDLKAIIDRCHPVGLVYAAVETIIIDAVLPDALLSRWKDGSKAPRALHTALDRIADYFGLDDEPTERKAPSHDDEQVAA